MPNNASYTVFTYNLIMTLHYKPVHITALLTHGVLIYVGLVVDFHTWPHRVLWPFTLAL